MNVLKWGCSPFLTSRPARYGLIDVPTLTRKSDLFIVGQSPTARLLAFHECAPLCLCEFDPPLTLLASL